MESCSREMGPLGLNSSMVIASLRFLSLFSSTACRRCRCIALKILTLSHYSLYPVSFPSLQNYSYAHHTNHSKLTLLLPPPFSLSLSLVSDVERTLSVSFCTNLSFYVSLFSLPLFTFRNTSTSQSHHVDTNHSLTLERTAVCR